VRIERQVVLKPHADVRLRWRSRARHELEFEGSQGTNSAFELRRWSAVGNFDFVQVNPVIASLPMKLWTVISWFELFAGARLSPSWQVTMGEGANSRARQNRCSGNRIVCSS